MDDYNQFKSALMKELADALGLPEDVLTMEFNRSEIIQTESYKSIMRNRKSDEEFKKAFQPYVDALKKKFLREYANYLATGQWNDKRSR